MNWFWLNMPLAAVFFGAWVGVPLWLVFKHSDGRRPPVVVQAYQDVQAAPQAALSGQRRDQLIGV